MAPFWIGLALLVAACGSDDGTDSHGSGTGGQGAGASAGAGGSSAAPGGGAGGVAPGSEANCENGSDDDGDGAVDCADPDCGIQAVCALDPGGHVATLEVEAPGHTPFVLHGTLPVPPGVFPRADGKSPFGVLDSNGQTAPAQVEVVSRYPSGSADVVEVIARVGYDSASVKPGDRVRYEVRVLEHEAPTAPATVDLPQLFAAGPVPLDAQVKNLAVQGLRIRARDVFGHRYERDLLTGHPKLHRHGNLALSARTYGTLSPDPSAPKGAPNGTLPHLMGVHAYLTLRALEPAVELTLQISNGSAGKDAQDPSDDALDDLYFQDLELVLPPGWDVVASVSDPTLGTAHDEGQKRIFPVITPPASGMHVIPKYFHVSRRLVIAPSATLALAKELATHAGLGFAVPGQSSTDAAAELFSFENPATGRFLPPRHFIPNLDHVGKDVIRQKLTAELSKYSALVQTGKPLLDAGGKGMYPVMFGNLGPFQPWGVQYGGMTGGTEIHPFEGVDVATSASRDGYRFLELVHRMRAARQANHLYEANGEGIAWENWVVDGPNGKYAPLRLFNSWDLKVCSACDPFGFKNAPLHQKTHVTQNGQVPSYQADLVGYDPEDHQHLIRLVRTQVALVWLGNDPFAKDDLVATAELANIQLLPIPLWYSGTTPKPSLGSLYDHLPTPPGKGVSWGRGEWWMQYALLGAYSVADDTWRAKKRQTFFDVVVDQVLAPGIIPCSGYIGVNVNKNTENKYRSRRGNEAAFGDTVMLGTLRTVYEGIDPARVQTLTDLIAKSTKASILDGLSWNPAWNAPYVEMPTAPASGGTPYCKWSELPADAQGYAQASGANKYEIYLPIAFGSELTGDPEFLTKGDLVLGSQVQAPTLLAKLQKDGLDALPIRAPLIACLERGLCK